MLLVSGVEVLALCSVTCGGEIQVLGAGTSAVVELLPLRVLLSTNSCGCGQQLMQQQPV